MAAAIQFANLARTPAPMSQFQTNYLTHHFIAQLIGMVVWPTRSLHHASHPLTQKTLLPFITGFRADPVFLAQRRKIRRSHRFQSKLNFLFHRFAFSPRHIRPSCSLSRLKSVTYVLNLLCYLCSEPGPGAPSITGKVTRIGARMEQRGRERHRWGNREVETGGST